MIGVPGSEKSSALMSSMRRRLLPEQRRQAAADAEIDPRARIVRIDAVHVVALLVGHHLQRELVVVAQEGRPLAIRRNRGRLLQDVDDREAILHLQRHEEPRHDGEVEVHVALVAVAEIRRGVLGPLVRLGEQHAVADTSRRTCARSFFRNACVSGRFSQFVPSRS